MSSKIELGFDYKNGHHIPTIKISLEPCGPEGLVWDERDMLGKRIEKLIATPVVERQPVYEVQWNSIHGPEGWKVVDAPTYARCQGPLWDRRMNWTAPPELAELQAELADTNVRLSNSIEQADELQATIARLTTENEQLNVDLVEAKADASRSKLGHKQLCAKHAETLAEIERLKGGQSEPVALQHVAVAEGGKLRWMTGRKMQECELYAMPYGSAINFPVYTSQPAPVAVVLPDYRKPAFYFSRVGNCALAVGLADEWNACLDKVKELNQ